MVPDLLAGGAFGRLPSHGFLQFDVGFNGLADEIWRAASGLRQKADIVPDATLGVLRGPKCHENRCHLNWDFCGKG